ncbi:MAG TPA: dienelactone hydrolase family protein [Isosphaeraceae bacterium]|jgi:carboxymethylenebutenolidase
MDSTDRFDCRGRGITVERFAPTTSGRHPAVVILHGSGGMPAGGLAFRAFARVLAGRGYVALIPHYFERTGTTAADERTIPVNFPAWMEAVAAAVTFAAGRPDVDPARIGLLGFSLGGYLALATATVDPRIRAVVECFGGLPEVLTSDAGKLPPTLILHGDADAVVPVSEAYKLQQLLTEHRVPHEIQIYRGVGHAFLGPSAEDSGRRTLAFFDTHVKPHGSTTP